jgi:hypothetical protein
VILVALVFLFPLYWGLSTSLRTPLETFTIAGLGIPRIDFAPTLDSSADLLVRPNPKLRARRKAASKKPRPRRPNAWWGIDMTPKSNLGHERGFRLDLSGGHARPALQEGGRPLRRPVGRSWHWLIALNRAVSRQFPRACATAA